MRSVKWQIPTMVVVGVLMQAAFASAGTVKAAQTIGFADDADVRPKIKDECKLQTKVPAFLKDFSSDVELVTGDPGGTGRVLSMRVTQVHAPGGGMFSGPKWMTVTGELHEDGEMIGNFTARRGSGGGAFGGYKGTCSILGRCAKTIGKDIAAWLNSPGKDSRLGDAR